MTPRTVDEKKYVDLHVHSTYSDGSSPPEEVLELAAQKGLQAISITDHDSIGAYPQASRRGAELGIDVITGIELSSEAEGIDIHILGYYVDIANPALAARLRDVKEARYVRARKMVENLNHQGIDLQFETVLKVAGEGVIGRPHIALAMLREELVYSFREAFEKYLGYDSPVYVEKYQMQPREVFELILQAGGMPVLAHPGVTKVDDRIPEFVNDGLMGIEVYHSEHTPDDQRKYKRVCRKYGLVITGGSDYHNNDHNLSEIGSPKVPASILDQLYEKHDKVRQQG
jgi:3',5'-nucleoside bisphosphate phosphatase